MYWYATKYMYVEVYQQTSDRTSFKKHNWKIRKMVQNIEGAEDLWSIVTIDGGE